MRMKSNFLSTNEMLAALGYQTKPCLIGDLGYALMSASRKNKDCDWLKNHLDLFFRHLRREKKAKDVGKK